MMNMVKRLWKEEAGQGMTEYGLIIALVAVALIATVILFRDKVMGVFQGLADDARF